MEREFESYLYRIIIYFDESNFLNMYIDNFHQLHDCLCGDHLHKKFVIFDNNIGIHQIKKIEIFDIQGSLIDTINSDDLYERLDITVDKLKNTENDIIVQAMRTIYINNIIKTIEKHSKLMRECVSRFIKETNNLLFNYSDLN